MPGWAGVLRRVGAARDLTNEALALPSITTPVVLDGLPAGVPVSGRWVTSGGVGSGAPRCGADVVSYVKYPAAVHWCDKIQ